MATPVTSRQHRAGGHIIPVRYSFRLREGEQVVYDLQIDEATLRLVGRGDAEPPFWTILNFFQCPHCPLTVDVEPHCPLAVNLVGIVQRLDHLLSYEQVQVVVITRERVITQRTTAQSGISSLMGLVIAASGCPLTDFLKPMARFHLPFATEKETIWRAVSTYLLAQYFRRSRGEKPDYELHGLVRIYDDIEKMNVAIAKRLRAASKKDSAVNALVHLDVFAKHLTLPIQDSLEKIRDLFATIRFPE
jgi:hypothetical protein